MPTATSTTRTPRASCRVGCVLAALLVTLGGLRLLVAAEPGQVVDAARAEAALVAVRPPRRVSPGTYRITTSDFASAVEHTSRKIECIPDACGFPRVRPLDASAFDVDWAALEARVLAVLLPSLETDEARGFSSLPEAWVPVSTCRLGCPGALRTPSALAARF